MDEAEYIEKRLDDQIKWYDRESQCNQRWYKRLRAAEFVAAGLIPFLVGYVSETTPVFKVTVGFLGVIVAVIAGLVSLYRFQELWIEYRTTCESLKHEKYLYLTKTEPYDGEDRFPVLVQRVESLISKEHSKWVQYFSSIQEKGRRGKGAS